MRRALTGILAAAAVLTPASFAHAGVYADDLTKCLVSHASESDRIHLMVWIYSAMSAHPAVKAYSTITPAQQTSASKETAALMQRLLTVDCRPETIAALKNEGASTIETAFNVLGQVATRGLMTDPAVAAQVSALDKYIDPSKFTDLAK